MLLGLVSIALFCLGGIWLLKATRPMPEMPQETETLYLLPRSSNEIAAIEFSGENHEPWYAKEMMASCWKTKGMFRCVRM